MLQKDPYLLTIIFIFGSMIGSFLNVVILRLPLPAASVVFPASHCPKCLAPLRWFENIPIISWLVLRGKCAHCNTSIAAQYPIVELCTGLLGVANTVVFGFTPAAVGYFLFSAALITIIWIDIHHQIIPDIISLPGIVIGFGFSFFSPLVTWQDSLYGLLAGGGIFFAIAYGYFLIRKQEGLGGGDVKLLAMLGAFLGWQSLLFIILVSSLTGSLFGLAAMTVQKKGGATRIPFGPFLALSGLAYLFFNKKIQYIFWLYSGYFN